MGMEDVLWLTAVLVTANYNEARTEIFFVFWGGGFVCFTSKSIELAPLGKFAHI